MPRTILRQTFIALRARRQAYRIATDFIYENPIDVETFPCRSCGHQVHPREMSDAGWVLCTVCGESNLAPPHLRSRATVRSVRRERYDDWRDSANQERHRRVMFFALLFVYAALFLTWLITFAGFR